MMGNAPLHRSVLALALLCAGVGDVRAEEERSTALAYTFATAGLLVPAWTAQAIMPKSGESPTWSPRWVGTFAGYYASIAWGTSLGYYYSGNARYATISGLGKTALLAAGTGTHWLVERSARHTYILGLTVIAVALWDFGDYVLLYRDVREQNRERAATLIVPGLPGNPQLRLADDRFSLSFSLSL